MAILVSVIKDGSAIILTGKTILSLPIVKEGFLQNQGPLVMP